MLSIARLLSKCSCSDSAGDNEWPKDNDDDGSGDEHPEDVAVGDSTSGLVASKVSSSGEFSVQSAHHIFSRKASTEE